MLSRYLLALLLVGSLFSCQTFNKDELQLLEKHMLQISKSADASRLEARVLQFYLLHQVDAHGNRRADQEISVVAAQIEAQNQELRACLDDLKRKPGHPTEELWGAIRRFDSLYQLTTPDHISSLMDFHTWAEGGVGASHSDLRALLGKLSDPDRRLLYHLLDMEVAQRVRQAMEHQAQKVAGGVGFDLVEPELVIHQLRVTEGATIDSVYLQGEAYLKADPHLYSLSEVQHAIPIAIEDGDVQIPLLEMGFRPFALQDVLTSEAKLIGLDPFNGDTVSMPFYAGSDYE